MDDEIDDIAYRAKVKQARQDGFNAGYRNAGDDAMPYYEDLNLDQEWALGYTHGAAQRQAEYAEWLKNEIADGQRAANPHDFDIGRYEAFLIKRAETRRGG